MQKFEEFWKKHNFPEETRGIAAAIWFEASGQAMEDAALQLKQYVGVAPETSHNNSLNHDQS